MIAERGLLIGIFRVFTQTSNGVVTEKQHESVQEFQRPWISISIGLEKNDVAWLQAATLLRTLVRQVSVVERNLHVWSYALVNASDRVNGRVDVQDLAMMF